MMTPAGWRLVPVEPTEEMLTHGSMFEQQYRGCVSAAPDPLMDGDLVDCVAIELALARHRGGAIHDQARAVLALFRGERA